MKRPKPINTTKEHAQSICLHVHACTHAYMQQTQPMRQGYRVKRLAEWVSLDCKFCPCSPASASIICQLSDKHVQLSRCAAYRTLPNFFHSLCLNAFPNLLSLCKNITDRPHRKISQPSECNLLLPLSEEQVTSAGKVSWPQAPSPASIPLLSLLTVVLRTGEEELGMHTSHAWNCMLAHGCTAPLPPSQTAPLPLFPSSP